MAERLIKSFDMRLSTPDCLPGSERYRARVDLQDDIGEALPYLNAELEGGDYHPNTKVLLWKEGGKKYAFRPREIIIAPVESRAEAQTLAEGIVGVVNDVWERRDGIEPDFKGKKPLPNVLDICKLLPGTNCRECGFPTCMAFAAALRGDPSKLSLCPRLSEQDLVGVLF